MSSLDAATCKACRGEAQGNRPRWSNLYEPSPPFHNSCVSSLPVVLFILLDQLEGNDYILKWGTVDKLVEKMTSDLTPGML